MKKLLMAMTIAVAVLTALFANGSTETTTTKNVELGSEPVTITVWHCASDES